MTLYEALKALQKDLHKGKLPIPNCGICANLDNYVKDGSLSTEFKSAMKAWKHFSGSIMYPIKGGSLAYDESWGTDAMWSKTQRYGRLRRSLLDHLVKTLKPQESETYKQLVKLKSKLRAGDPYMCWIAKDNGLLLAHKVIEDKVHDEMNGMYGALLNVYRNKYCTNSSKAYLNTPAYQKFRKEWLDKLIKEHA